MFKGILSLVPLDTKLGGLLWNNIRSLNVLKVYNHTVTVYHSPD